MKLVDDSLLEQLNTLVVLLDHKGRIVHTGNSVKKLLGYYPAELTGISWWRMIEKQDGQAVNSPELKMLLHPGSEVKSVSFERKIKTSGGETCWIRWNILKTEDNSFVLVGNDITLSKLTEYKLQQLNRELKSKNNELTDSIQYARRLQEAIFPDISRLNHYFQGAFVYYKPKDVLSGDFYWYHRSGNKLVVAAVDCTGHGVPGALLSILANSLLRDVVINKGMELPSAILYSLDEELSTALSNDKNADVTKDGMDVAVCVFDFEKDTFTFSGAFRPLVRVTNGGLIEYKGSRYPIGYFHDEEKQFYDVSGSLQQGDCFYLFSDGYADQFGGEISTGKAARKMNRKRFYDLLLTSSNMETSEQESFLHYAHNNWKQNEEQTDDVMVMGIKV
ncbi:MAG: SpoIIE family protein phosphatase [Bacteroidota bacterium]